MSLFKVRYMLQDGRAGCDRVRAYDEADAIERIFATHGHARIISCLLVGRAD